MNGRLFISNQSLSQYPFLVEVIQSLQDPGCFMQKMKEYHHQEFNFATCLLICVNTCKKEQDILNKQLSILEKELLDSNSESADEEEPLFLMVYAQIIALYFMQAELYAWSSKLAIDRKEVKLACPHYQFAMEALATAADHSNQIAEQSYYADEPRVNHHKAIFEDILKKSNTYGLINPIAAVQKIKEMISAPLEQLLLQQSTTNRPARRMM